MTLRIILKLASAAAACCPCHQTRPLPNASLQRVTRVLCATMSKSSGILLHEIFQVVTYFHNECSISVYFSQKKDPICFLTRFHPLASSCHRLHIMHGISVVQKLLSLSFEDMRPSWPLPRTLSSAYFAGENYLVQTDFHFCVGQSDNVYGLP